jgi:ATP/maltotriose-dependent transcriptional regulator MalT/two-component SAPR family response regulator
MPPPIPISKTKIIVPSRRPELLSRPRLLENLKSLLDNKLILLSAPAGYGKTSLLVDLAHHVEMPVCWLSLDPLDRDPQRFFAYLIACIAERFPKVGEVSRSRLRRSNSIEQDMEAILVLLTNEIYDNVEEDFLLILDDYHLLDDVPVISSLVNRFLNLVVENCHVILSSRTLPSLPDVTLMVAREQVAGLSHIDLAFQPVELQALYAQNYRQRLSDEAAREFVAQTGGWITGMVLSNLPGMPRVSGVDTFSYLGQQVLDRQPAHIREFLLRTSLPEEFNAQFCAMVLGPLYPDPPNWYDLMSLILEKNLFVLPLDSDGRWLRYHPLFREFLQKRLREERPHEVRPILEEMVKAYEKLGEWEKAYHTCRELNDLDALATVIEHAGTPMLQNALVTLEGWLNSLPPAMLQTRPGLISLQGPLLAVKGNLQESKELLDRAVSLFRQTNSVEGLTVALIRRANTLRLLGNYSSALEDIENALHLSSADTALQFYHAEALRLKGLCLFWLGSPRQAIEALEHSLSLYSAMKEVARIPIVLMETGMVYYTLGDINAARTSYQKAIQIKQAEGDIFYQADILNNLAVLYHQMGEYELAAETFEMGLTCARKSRNLRTEALLLAGLGDLYSEVEIFDAASQAYVQAEAVVGNLPGQQYISNYLVIARCNLLLAQGKLEEAGQLIQEFQERIQESQSAYEHKLLALALGKYHLFKGAAKDAILSLEEAKRLFIQDRQGLEAEASMVWLAAACEAAGEKEKARSEMREVLSVNVSPRHTLLVVVRQALSWLENLQTDPIFGRRLSSLVEKAQRLNSKLPAIRRTLRRHTNSIQVPSATLMIRAFGIPEVSVSSRAVTMSQWRTQSVRDLFFYFLYRQEAVTKEQIGLALWPEVEDVQALKKRFKNEIYRLRRAVGRDVIVFEDEYYRFNRELDYEYDVEAFDSHLQRAHKATEPSARIEYLQKAVDLVRGPYLADVTGEWAVTERERLNQAYAAALEELAYLYLDTNQLKQCLSICQLALKHNRFHEVIYQIEMRALAALGDRPALVRRYQACREAMQELGVPVSDETERIYRQLTF